MKYAFLLIFIVAGCTSPAEQLTISSNKYFQVEKLFTDSNGYTVYRFADGGKQHYYVIPEGKTMTTIDQSDDKHEDHYHENIPTVK